MSQRNIKTNKIMDMHISTEEVLGPPKVDMMGVGMMLLLALVVGFASSMGVVLVAFLTLGKFSLESGAAPMLLSMITFFAFLLGDMLYVWGAKKIFPDIYKGSRMVFMHITIFVIVVYIFVIPLYIVAPNASTNSSLGILAAYILHLFINIFGLEIIVSILSGYRYTLLSFYASIIGLVGGVVFMFSMHQFIGSDTKNSLFILLGFGAIAFAIFTFSAIFTKFLYYRYYIVSGSDPIGNTFAMIEEEEREEEREAEKILLNQ